MARLTPEDRAFIDAVNAELNDETAIAFELPDNAISRVIDRVAKWSWEWIDIATQQVWLGIHAADVVASRSDCLNARLKLPDYVESIADFRTAAATFGTSVTDFIRNSAIRTYSMSYGTSQRAGVTGTTEYAGRLADTMVQLYAVAAAHNQFERSVSHNFNKASGVLNIIGACDKDVLLLIEQRLPYEQLYNIYEFKELVVAECMAKLGRIIGTFNFELPGNVSINFDMIQSEGKERAEQIRSDIKEVNGNSVTLYKQ